VLTYGAVREVLQACLTSPGVLEPVKRGKTLLVDGGYVSDEAFAALREAGVDSIVSVDPAARFASPDLTGLQGAAAPASLLSLLRRPGTLRRATDLQLAVAAEGDPLTGPADPASQVEAGREKARPLVQRWLASHERRPGDAAPL
jgi:predicted acylesterase/phospholipase RssA